MTLSQFFTRTSHNLRGTDEDPPVFGDDEAIYWLETLNRVKDQLYEDLNIGWRNTYEVRDLGTVSSSTTPSFDLDDDFLGLSGDNTGGDGVSAGVYIIKTDNNRVDIPVVLAEQRSPYVRNAFIAGFNPQVLNITDEIKSTENIIGGHLFVPGYYLPADLTKASDPLPFLDPNYACMAVAAEIAFNDITYESKAPDLNNKANDLLKKMIANNRKLGYRAVNKVPYNIKRIRNTRVN